MFAAISDTVRPTLQILENMQDAQPRQLTKDEMYLNLKTEIANRFPNFTQAQYQMAIKQLCELIDY